MPRSAFELTLGARLLAVVASVFCIGLFALPHAASGEGDLLFGANDVEFLNMMGNLEGPRGFTTVSDFAPVPPHRPLTEMTLAEVLGYQRDIRSMGTVSSAVGRYQFIYPTLLALIEDHDIADTLIFDEEVQTYLARFMMHDCGFYDRKVNLLGLGNCLADAWAALPVVSGPMRGQSAYAGDGINKAFTSPTAVLDVLDRRFDW